MRTFRVQYLRTGFKLENNKNVQMWDVKKEFCAKHPQSWYSNNSLKPEILDISCNGVSLDNDIKLDEIVYWRDTLMITENKYKREFNIMVNQLVSSNSERTHQITVQDSNTIWVVKRKFCDKLVESDKLMVNLNLKSIQFSFQGDILNDGQLLENLDISDGDTIMAVEILRNTITQFSVQYLENFIDLRMNKSTQMWDVKKEFCKLHSQRWDPIHKLKPDNLNISHDVVLLENDFTLNKICINYGDILIITDRERTKKIFILVKYRAISVRITVQNSNTIWVVKRKFCDKIIEEDPESVELSFEGDVLNDREMLGNLKIGEGDTIIAIDKLRHEMRRNITVKYLVCDTKLRKDERTLMWDVKKEICRLQSQNVYSNNLLQYCMLNPQNCDISCNGVLLENDISLKKLCVNDSDTLIITDRKYIKEFVLSVRYHMIFIRITVQDSSTIWVVKRLFLDKLFQGDEFNKNMSPECVQFVYRDEILNDNQILSNLEVGEDDRIIAVVIPRIIMIRINVVYLTNVIMLRMDERAQMWDVKREFCTKLTQSGSANDRLKPEFLDIYRNGILLENDVTLENTSVNNNYTLKLIETDGKFETEFDIYINFVNRRPFKITVHDSNTIWLIKRKLCDKLIETDKSLAIANPNYIHLSFQGDLLDNANKLRNVGICQYDTIIAVSYLK